ncbi:MAG: Smr/MutS family protein [Pseudomonadota bacterium]
MPGKPPAPPADPASDEELLARELAGVRPLASEPREPTARERFDRELAERRRAAATEGATADRFAVGGLSAVTPVAGDALLEFRRDGLQLRQWQKLRKGQLSWLLGVDLHGTTREEALRAVDRLIRQAQEEGTNCIRVVHGKGHGPDPAALTIKAELNHWLRRHPQVLAFCSALPADGGAGALYVLLRRQRPE